jgi:ribosome biogenesis GTPase
LARVEAVDEAREGTVLRAQSGHCLVSDRDVVYRCRVRGRLRKGERSAQTVAVAGDRVRFRPVPSDGTAEPSGVIEVVLPRRNRISRMAARRSGGRVEQVLMANLDQVVAVQSVAQPAPSAGFVDRLLVAAERFGVAGVLCLNKCDLDRALAADARWDYYRGLGYGLLRVSALTGEGVDALRGLLGGRISLLLGASGTGKSSLLNAVAPGLDLRVADVTEKSGLGRHTTTHTELYPLPGGGFIADSPGRRGFDPWDVAPGELRDLFPDWGRLEPPCRFRTCLHREEPGCGVKAAVARGDVPAWRHDAYLRLLADLEERQRGVWE